MIKANLDVALDKTNGYIGIRIRVRDPKGFVLVARNTTKIKYINRANIGYFTYSKVYASFVST